MSQLSSPTAAEKQGADFVEPQTSQPGVEPAPDLIDQESPTQSNPPSLFLTADWRHLVVVNYAVDPRLLLPSVPRGTELDYFECDCLVSVVGFMFERSKLLGRLAIPGLSRFEEVNLRFYVKRNVEGECRRAVVFIKELAQSRLVRLVANWWFAEHYQTVKLDHDFTWTDQTNPSAGGRFAYRWRSGREQGELVAETDGPLAPLPSGSLSEFILEHYWAYGRRPNGDTLEYRVEHPRWRAWPVAKCHLHADVAALYGPEFAAPLSAEPHSALVADGSPVKLFSPRVLKFG